MVIPPCLERDHFMDLCIDSRMIDSSGIGTVLKNVIPFLTDFRLSLIVNANFSKAAEAYRLIPCDASIYSIREQFVLPSLIPKCDLFWSPHYNIPIFPIRAKKRIVTIHDACHLAFKNSLGWKQKFYAQAMLKQATSRSDLVITDSFFSRFELNKYLSPTNEIHVIYPAVDFDRFSQEPSSGSTDSLIRKYSLPSSFFLVVGNVKPHKNLKLILDAYEQFSIEIPLVVIGKINGLSQLDPSIQRIRNSPKLQNKIFLVGEVLDKEIPIFYHLAQALIFPSLYEGFGLPPLEAMASGCPTIVSNRASLPEVCGDAAFMINPDDPEELANAMFKVSSDPDLQKELIKKGKLQARRFSWIETGKQYVKLFHEVMLTSKS